MVANGKINTRLSPSVHNACVHKCRSGATWCVHVAVHFSLQFSLVEDQNMKRCQHPVWLICIKYTWVCYSELPMPRFFLLFEKLHFIFNNLMMNKRYSIAVYLVSMDGIVSAIQGIPQLKFSLRHTASGSASGSRKSQSCTTNACIECVIESEHLHSSKYDHPLSSLE